jgi:hypothetical protein
VHHGHTTIILSRAISVNFSQFSDLAQSTVVEDLMVWTRRRFGVSQGGRIGLGVDRLDYTKGLMKRLWALKDFFNRYPEYRGTCRSSNTLRTSVVNGVKHAGIPERSLRSFPSSNAGIHLIVRFSRLGYLYARRNTVTLWTGGNHEE